MTIRTEIREIVTHMPGITSGEITELMPHVKRQTVYAEMNRAHSVGEFLREKASATSKRGRPEYVWRINPLYDPTKKPVDLPVVPSASTASAPQKITVALDLDAESTRAALTSLRVELEQLRAWKADAIARHPDLAVDPLVLKARELVASETPDKILAEQIRSGIKDGILPMRVALRLLSEGV